jgi:hypothetical protein
MSRFVTLLVAGTIAIGTAHSGVILNTFDAPLTTFGGATTVHALGVTFAYTGSGSAIYGDSIGTNGLGLEPQFVDGVLDGAPTGTLTLTFDAPTTFLSFNIVFVPLQGSSGGQVLIGSTSTPFTTASGSSCGGFCSVGTFSVTPSSSFSTAVISFSANGAQQFAIDNLSYSTPDATGPGTVPEPASFTLIGLGTLLLAGSSRLYRRRRSTVSRQ